MKLNKKIQCKKCNIIVEENGSCDCGNLVITNNVVFLKEGKEGIDTKDLSLLLLNE